MITDVAKAHLMQDGCVRVEWQVWPELADDVIVLLLRYGLRRCNNKSMHGSPTGTVRVSDVSRRSVPPRRTERARHPQRTFQDILRKLRL